MHGAASGMDGRGIGTHGMAIAVRESDDVEQPSPHQETSTRHCRAHHHREFALRWDSRRTSPADVETLANTLETAVASGARFSPGDIVHIGWVPLRVVEAPSKMLSLVEPDFCGSPLRYAQGVDAALGHLRAQDDFAARLGLDDVIARPCLTDRVRVCGHLTSRGLVLDREERGWIVVCGDPETDDHRLIDGTLYDLVCRFPHVVDFLALPVGTTVACTDVGDAIVWQEGREVGVRTGMSIAARLSRVTRPVARCGGNR
jgi:hypothetical protein